MVDDDQPVRDGGSGAGQRDQTGEQRGKARRSPAEGTSRVFLVRRSY